MMTAPLRAFKFVEVGFLLGEAVAAAHASARVATLKEPLKERERFRESGFVGVFGGISD